MFKNQFINTTTDLNVNEQNLFKNKLNELVGLHYGVQKYFSYIVTVGFYWCRKPEYLEKTTDLPQVTEKLSHNVVSRTPRHEWDSNSQF